jgi:hypothetical protein
LEVALDEHLQANSSIFSGEKRLADYYKRLSQPVRVSSPIKKDPKSESSTASDEVKKSARRRNTRVKDEVSVTCVLPLLFPFPFDTYTGACERSMLTALYSPNVDD